MKSIFGHLWSLSLKTQQGTWWNFGTKKPRNPRHQETLNPINFWSQGTKQLRNQNTQKLRNQKHLEIKKSRSQQSKNNKPRNRDTKKPRNQETKQLRTQEIERPRNQETKELKYQVTKKTYPPSPQPRRPPLHPTSLDAAAFPASMPQPSQPRWGHKMSRRR